MTARAQATKAQIRRAIAAAQERGLRVTGIRPDGTIVLEDEPRLDTAPATRSKWEDQEA